MTDPKADIEKGNAALNSVLAAVLLTGLKIGVGVMSGSLGILAEAAHSGLDLLAAIVTLVAVRVSSIPAYQNHAYGHGKAENLSALGETLLLLATCVWIISEALERLTAHGVDTAPLEVETSDPREIAQLMADSSLPPPRTQHEDRGMAVGALSEPLLCAFLRLLDLLDEPEHIPILAPLVQREILYRLLVGPQGPRLRQIGAAGCRSHQIARAIDWLKANFSQPLRIDDLATRVRMSTSAFHHHFRALTAMSPLQYQKWLRLHEARKLMLTEQIDAANAAFQVGYESPSQFSREYSRLFGAPPLRDIKNMKQMAVG